MSDYAFVANGKAYTPNGTHVDAANAEAHNAAIEAAELARWQSAPDTQLAYYTFPAERGGQSYRTSFHPVIWRNDETTGELLRAEVRTWTGKRLGAIITAKVYLHNFGARMVSMRVKGSNGAIYSGRASWDNGTCINLRKVKR